MTNRLFLLQVLLLVTIFIAMPQMVYAKPFFFNVATSATRGVYIDSSHRESMSESEVSISGEYLDDGGVTAGYGKTFVWMKVADMNIEQQHRFVSGRMYFWPHILQGRLTTRFDAHQINNNDVTGETDGVIVVAPQLSWLSYDASLYFDLGYANSRYRNQLDVHQYTPTVGMGFNDNADWIQLRGYQISGLNPARVVGKTQTSGMDVKWIHYFASRAALVPSFFSLGVMTGERSFAVDMDAMSVANLADLSTGSATLLLAWDIKTWGSFSVLAGKNRYRDVDFSNNYTLNLVYANFTLKW